MTEHAQPWAPFAALQEVSWQSLPRRHIRPPSSDQSGFAPENFTTFAHFSVSSAMNFPN
jgi:hypothetical protein